MAKKRKRPVGPDKGPEKKKQHVVINNVKEAVEFKNNKRKYGLFTDFEDAGEWAKVSRSKQMPLMVEEEKRQAKEASEALKKQFEEASKQQPLMANTDGKDFTIAFIQMGQGDCCVMRTPGGKVIMIDCGTTSSDEAKEESKTFQTEVDDNWSDKEDLKEHDIPVSPEKDFLGRVRGILRKDNLLGTKNKIDYLILTHSDNDHYNQLKGLFDPMGITFGKVYHSAELSTYSANETVSFIETHVEADDKKNKQIFRVTHNDPNSKTIKLTRRDEKLQSNVEAVLPQASNGGYLLLNEDDNCKIWFLASDVDLDSGKGFKDRVKQDGSTPVNRGSLVTLVEAFGKKILICGDATKITEQYLLETSKEAFKELDILPAPHHGSLTSSSPNFVKNTDPCNVAVSASRKDQSHHLPRRETLRSYFWKMKDSKRPLEGDHAIFYWREGGQVNHCWSTLKQSIYTTGSQGSFGWTIFREKGGKVMMVYGILTGPVKETKKATST